MTLVSIIIPIYKTKDEYFRECLESCILQTYSNLEILIVDDGADDNLLKLADEYAGKDKRIRILHQSNSGAAAARNHGLSECTGEYVTFVDSDDYIASDNIEEALKRMKEDELQVLLWGSYKFYDDRKEKYMPYTADIRLFSGEMKQQLMMKTMVGHLSFYLEPASVFGSGSCCSKLYDVNFLRDNNLKYPEGIKRAEDVNFNIRVFDKAERIGYLNKHFYYYRQHGESATYQYRENGIEVFTGALLCLKTFLTEINASEVLWQTFYMRCMFFFLESMDMDYLNPENRDKLSIKVKKMKAVIDAEPYRSAIAKLDGRLLSISKKVPLLLIRLKMMRTLLLMYSFWRKM